MNTNIKRKRTENWSQNDKSLLRELCAEKVGIIENKSVDTNTNRIKKECWAQITEAFNSVSEVKRDVVRIQFQWRNMKMRAKAAESTYRKAKNKTGGGPPPLSPSKENQELIELIPNEFKIDSNKDDSDGIALQISDQHISIEVLDEFTLEDGHDSFNDKEINKENSQNQENIQNHVKHSTKTRKQKKIPHESDAAQKRELFELTKAFLTKEHEERMAILRIEKECRQRELEEKMAILRIEKQCRHKELENLNFS